jgi:hypothetical protein
MTTEYSNTHGAHLQLRWIIVSAVAVIALVPRLLFVNIPFERDEGAYAYVSDVVDSGGLPYRDAFDHKPPGIYYIYNIAFKLFGHGVTAPRIMAALFALAACVLSYILVYRITAQHVAGIITIAFFSLASFSPAYTGFNANAEIFTLPFIIGAIVLLVEDEVSLVRYFIAGLLCGMALMIKQSVIPAVVFVLGCSILRSIKTPTKLIAACLLSASGIVMPFIMFIVYFSARSALDAFWAGLLTFNFSYIAGPTIGQSFSFFLRRMGKILSADPVTWIAGSAGILLFLTLSQKKYSRWLFLSALVGAGASVAMGKYYYGHYFIIFIPFLAIGIGLGLAQMLPGRMKTTGIALSLIILACAVGLNIRYFGMSSDQMLVSCYGNLPFSQSVGISDYLKKQGTNSSVYIIGSEPQILFYAGLKTPTRFFYFYPLIYRSTLREAFRTEATNDLRNNMPDILIYVNHPSSHFISTAPNDQFLADLFRLFSEYRLVALSIFGHDELLVDESSLNNKELLTKIGALHIYKHTIEGQASAITLGEIFGL